MGKIANNNNTDNDLVSLENTISLKGFPPKLRKLAKFLLKNDVPCTISDACRELGLNRESIGVLIWRSKQKGNDFNRFIDEQSKMILHVGKAEVYKALQQGAVSQSSTSHNDRKTYLQLTGDLKESANLNIGSLTIGVNINNVQPQDNRDKGVIDVEPVIPKIK